MMANTSANFQTLFQTLIYLIVAYLGLNFFPDEILSPNPERAVIQHFLIVLFCVGYATHKLYESWSKTAADCVLAFPIISFMLTISTPSALQTPMTGAYLIVVWLFFVGATLSSKNKQTMLGPFVIKSLLHISIMLYCIHNYQTGLVHSNGTILLLLWGMLVIWLNKPVGYLIRTLWKLIFYVFESIYEALWHTVVKTWLFICDSWVSAVFSLFMLLAMIVFLGLLLYEKICAACRIIKAQILCGTRFILKRIHALARLIYKIICTILFSMVFILIYACFMTMVSLGILIAVARFYFGIPLILTLKALNWVKNALPDYILNTCLFIANVVYWLIAQVIKLLALVLRFIKKVIARTCWCLGRLISLIYAIVRILYYSVILTIYCGCHLFHNILIELNDAFNRCLVVMNDAVYLSLAFLLYCMITPIIWLMPYVRYGHKKVFQAVNACQTIAMMFYQLIINHPRFKRNVLMLILGIANFIILQDFLSDYEQLLLGTMLLFVLRGMDEYAHSNPLLLQISLSSLLIMELCVTWYIAVPIKLQTTWHCISMTGVALSHFGQLKITSHQALYRGFTQATVVILVLGTFVNINFLTQYYAIIAFVSLYSIWHRQINQCLEWGFNKLAHGFMTKVTISQDNKQSIGMYIFVVYMVVAFIIMRFDVEEHWLGYLVVFIKTILCVKLMSVLSKKQVVQ